MRTAVSHTDINVTHLFKTDMNFQHHPVSLTRVKSQTGQGSGRSELNQMISAQYPCVLFLPKPPKLRALAGVRGKCCWWKGALSQEVVSGFGKKRCDHNTISLHCFSNSSLHPPYLTVLQFQLTEMLSIKVPARQYAAAMSHWRGTGIRWQWKWLCTYFRGAFITRHR